MAAYWYELVQLSDYFCEETDNFVGNMVYCHILQGASETLSCTFTMQLIVDQLSELC